MFDAFYRARNFINNTFKPQELDEDGAAATVQDMKSNSVDEDDRKPPAKEVQKELRRSPRVTNSWRIGYNEESDSDEDVEGEGRERNLISTSKADSEGVLHDVTDETYDLDDNPGRQKGRNDGERTPHFADETYDVVDSNSGIKWDQSKYLDESWEKKYQQLVQYKKEHGHCNVPFLTPKLGSWVQTQRRQCKDSDKVEKLNRLGFSWNVRVDMWNEKFEELKEFKRVNGHLKVPTNNKLGKWVSKQRTRCTDPIRRGKLDSIGFIWDVLENQFQDKYNELVEYKKRHGHCEVPFKYGPLGLWCNDLRMKGCKNPARHEKLTKLGFRWVTRRSQKMITPPKIIIEKKTAAEKKTEKTTIKQVSERSTITSDNGNLHSDAHGTREVKWEQRYQELIVFQMKHGHCNVASGTPLGNWVSQQRTLSKDNTYRRERLNRLGFCWHPRGSSWDQSFGESKEFERLGGHPNAPSADDEGTWCTDHQEGNCTEPAHLENPIELGCCIHTRDNIKKNALKKPPKKKAPKKRATAKNRVIIEKVTRSAKI